MSTLNVEQLLEPVSPDQPCGENLEYEADFGELERAAQFKPEQQYGDTKFEAEEPNWRDVRDRSIELFGRTKDLRVATYLAQSVLRTDGLSGFRDALAIIRGLVEKYWKEVHPQLDPDDDLDPALRVNTITTLCDKDACLSPLTDAFLADSAAGQIAFRDYQIALGELPPRSGQEPADMSTVESAFTAVEPDVLLATQSAAQGAAEDIASIESTVTQEVGVERSVGLDGISDLLRRIAKLVDEHVERRGLLRAADETPADESFSAPTDGEDFLSAGGDEESVVEVASVAAPAFDEVRSRDDVIRLLDKICDYYRDFEPSSPVPILLRRAKRIATMDFMDLLRELAPGGLAEIELLKGAGDSEMSS